MNKEIFDEMGTEVLFNKFGNNPENQIDGLAFTYEEVRVIKELIFGKEVARDEH